MKPYLVLYNLVNACGWAWVLYLAVTSVLEKKAPSTAWKSIQMPLLVTQSLAGLEILHSLFRIVPSPIVSTFMQVFSRYAVMWGYTYVFAEAQAHWSMYLMVTSWALVEVPRYLFYAVNLVGAVPYPLFWLRYTLFAILYPSGISGEIIQIVTCLPVLLRRCVPCWYLSLFLLSLYLPGSPFMFLHMVTQRKKSFKARKDKQQAASGKSTAPPSAGVDFPLDDKGQRSTTVVNQGAFVAAIAAVDKAASEAAAKEKNWRFGYSKHVVKNVELCCASEAQCLTIAKAGLEYLHSKFEFVRPEGQPKLSVLQAMDAVEGTFYTYTIEGSGKRDPNFEYYVPYQKFGEKSVRNLSGKELLAQLDVWVQRGTIEKDARDAIANLVNKPEYHSTAIKDMYFVLLGAMSAMGPLRVLLEIGANVVAVDINRKPVWQKLIELARKSPGRVLVPISKPKDQIKDDDDLASCAGADLLQQTPQIARWIASLNPTSRLIIGGYAYLDSALFVRLAIAMDAIMATVLKTRKDAGLAFLCSPTDVFVTENDCRAAQVAALKKIPLWQSVLRMIVPKRMLVPNAIKQVVAGGDTYSIVDGLAVAQGPNYALAKRLQHWRCMLARSQGHCVSTNIAPSTATASVVHNPQFAAAYIGMGYFSPLEIVYQDLSNATMTALLLNDVCNPNAAANPKTPIGNQVRLFSKTSLHFGIWRMAFKCGSIGEVSALIGYALMYKNVLALLAVSAGGFVGVLVQNGAPHTWF